MIKQFQGQYRWLSNFWNCRIEYNGRVFTSVEHGYQYSKCVTQEDKDRMFATTKPGDLKRLGRKIKVRPDLNDVKLEIMEGLVRQKFQDPVLREKLISTGTEELQEGNRWGDEFWGISFKTGKGENHLGKILMKVRDELRSKTKTLKELLAVCKKCDGRPIHPKSDPWLGSCTRKVEGEWVVCQLREEILCKVREKREERRREGRENPEIDEVDRKMEENTERVKKLIVRDKEKLERLELKRQLEEELNEITERLKEQLYS